MNYSIAFRNLPFEPDRRQVVYVENQYDEYINAIIKSHYEQLKRTFAMAHLEFVYLPMFFNDEETKEKVLYYAPYLTTDILEKAELRSSYLLGYMSLVKNREKIAPSFLYAPKKEGDEWVYLGLTINLPGTNDRDSFQWLERAVLGIADQLFAVSRYQRRYDVDLEACTPLPDDEQRVIKPSRSKRATTPNQWWMMRKRFHLSKEIVPDDDFCFEESAEPTLPRLDEIGEEDVRDTLEELERNIEKLRLWGIPLSALVEFVAKHETVSRLLITDDYSIFLPDYNNLEVKMGPFYKAVYCLFINHPEGIVLQLLEDHHRELVNYYLQTTRKTELTPRMADTIRRLEHPVDSSIHYTLSRINFYFRETIDEHLAKHYYIVGKPGEPYKVALDRNLIVFDDDEDFEEKGGVEE